MGGAQERNSRLAGIRGRIDDIDDRIADLISQRMECIEDVKRAKQADSGNAEAVIRPGREAAIVRRMLARTGGRLPAASVVRIWRELIAAATRLQVPLEVHLGPGEALGEAAQQAYFHFGTVTPIIVHDTPVQALLAVADGPGRVALLPFRDSAGSDGEAPWWWTMAKAEGRPLHVVGALPFLRMAGAAPGVPAFAVVAAFAPEESGEDATMVVALGQRDRNGKEVVAALAAAGLDAAVVDRWQTAAPERGFAVLACAEGLLDEQAEPLRRLGREKAIARVSVLGAYPRPYLVEEAGT